MTGDDRTEGADEPPVVDPDTFGPTERTNRVAGIVLASGTSTRFGDGNKLLASFDGEPLVRRSTRVLTATDVDPVIVVVGHEAGRVRSALDSLPVSVVRNEAYATGQSAAVRTGIEAVRERVDADAVVVALGDMPAVDPSTVETLIDGYEAGIGSILAAGYRGERGNPVLFDAAHFDALAGISGDRGARGLILGTDDVAIVDTDDPGVRRDVDVPEDLERFESG